MERLQKKYSLISSSKLIALTYDSQDDSDKL